MLTDFFFNFFLNFFFMALGKEFIRNVMPLKPEWLVEVAPHYHKKKDLETLGTDKKMPKGQGQGQGATKVL